MSSKLEMSVNHNASYEHFKIEIRKPETFWWLNLELKTEGITPHQWYVKEQQVTFMELIEYMEEYREGKYPELTDPYETLLVAIYVLYKSGCFFAEITNTQVSWQAVEAFLDKKIEDFCQYQDKFDVHELLAKDTVEKVELLPLLRAEVGKKFAFYTHIEGNQMNWWENVYDVANLTLQEIPEELKDNINACLAKPIQAPSDDYQAFFGEATLRFLDEKNNVLPLFEVIIRYLMNDPAIEGADSSILVGPRLILSDRPWEMTTDEYLFCIVCMKEDYNPQEHNLRATKQLVQNMVVTRMFVDKIRKAHYYNPDESVKYEKAVAHLGYPDISNFQHVHQKGHAAAGVRATLRGPVAIDIEQDGNTTTFTGFSDVRVFRSNNENAFNMKNLYRTITYSRWVKHIFEVTFAQGATFHPENTDPDITFFARGGKK